MQHDQIQVLNYCTHAIDDLEEIAAATAKRMPQASVVYRKVIGMLGRCTKFLMPNCGEFVSPHDLRQAHLDLARLPFPLVAFEAPWVKESSVEYLGEFRQTASTKRIALCWELSSDFELLPGMNRISGKFPQGGVFILPVYWTANSNRWHVALGGSFVPYDNEIISIKDREGLPGATVEAQAAVFNAGWAKESSGMIVAEPFLALPELFDEAVEHYEGERQKAFTQIILDSRDEVQMYVQACAVINCQNVGRVEVQPAAALNKKRLANGKRPLFSYHVLQLTDQAGSSNRSGAGEHSSPRMHLRRGHIRRLPNKTIWVRHTMVNAGSADGVVAKDYVLPGGGRT